MNEHILAAALTFAMLAGGTAAIGSELFAGQRTARPQQPAVATLPMVRIVGHRQAPLDVATLPPVLVVGHRTTADGVRVARASASNRME